MCKEGAASVQHLACLAFFLQQRDPGRQTRLARAGILLRLARLLFQGKLPKTLHLSSSSHGWRLACGACTWRPRACRLLLRNRTFFVFLPLLAESFTAAFSVSDYFLLLVHARFCSDITTPPTLASRVHADTSW